MRAYTTEVNTLKAMVKFLLVSGEGKCVVPDSWFAFDTDDYELVVERDDLNHTTTYKITEKETYNNDKTRREV